MPAGRNSMDVMPRPGESVLQGRASRSAASLLSMSMSTSMNSLGSMRKITPYGMPKTGSRITLPMDQALHNLSNSLSEANLGGGAAGLAGGGGSSWLQSATSASVLRPWTSPQQQAIPGHGAKRPNTSLSGR